MRQVYVAPQVSSICPLDYDGNLLDNASAYTDIDDRDWGGDLGGDVSGGSGSKAVFGDLLWDEEFRELADYIDEAKEMMKN